MKSVLPRLIGLLLGIALAASILSCKTVGKLQPGETEPSIESAVPICPEGCIKSSECPECPICKECICPSSEPITEAIPGCPPVPICGTCGDCPACPLPPCQPPDIGENTIINAFNQIQLLPTAPDTNMKVFIDLAALYAAPTTFYDHLKTSTKVSKFINEAQLKGLDTTEIDWIAAVCKTPDCKATPPAESKPDGFKCEPSLLVAHFTAPQKLTEILHIGTDWEPEPTQPAPAAYTLYINKNNPLDSFKKAVWPAQTDPADPASVTFLIDGEETTTQFVTSTAQKIHNANGNVNVTPLKMGYLAEMTAQVPSKCVEDLGILKNPPIAPPITYRTNAVVKICNSENYLQLYNNHYAKSQGASAGTFIADALAKVNYSTIDVDVFIKWIIGHPEVDHVSPVPNQTGVDPNSAIFVFFKDSVDPITVNNATFVVTPAMSGTISCDSASKNRTCSFKPNNSLKGNTTYNVTIKGGDNGVKAADNGLPMPDDYPWSFKTMCGDDGTYCTISNDCCSGFNCTAGICKP